MAVLNANRKSNSQNKKYSHGIAFMPNGFAFKFQEAACGIATAVDRNALLSQWVAGIFFLNLQAVICVM